MVKVFLAILSAGVVSLLLELSLLREFVYVFGATSRSNAVIISVFLVGLTLGAYLGTFVSKGLEAPAARSRFALAQMATVVYVAAFYATKNYFVYRSQSPALVVAFFLVSVLLPSLVSGVCYAFCVKILHPKGERAITLIYAVSTLGSVVGGLAHGLLLVPTWGMRSTYLCAAICGLLAVLLMTPRPSIARAIVLGGLGLASLFVVGSDATRALFSPPGLVFSKDSEFGVVETWNMTPAAAQGVNDWLHGAPEDLDSVGQVVDMRINNVHQSFNLLVDRRIHEQWASTSLEVVGRKASVLLLGYGSGVTAAAFAASDQVERVDIVENCAPIIEAARVHFPAEHAALAHNPKAHLIVDDFRGYVRFAQQAYDIIGMDHSISDPYQIGFFTTDFYALLKRVTKPGGLVMLLGEGLSWNTTRASFSHIYKNTEPGTEKFVQETCLYLSQVPFRDAVASKYSRVIWGAVPGVPVYTDAAVLY